MVFWKGKVAFITGGSSGIGAAFAALVVDRGGSAVIVDINEDAAAAVVAALGDRALFVRADVSCEADVTRAVDLAIGRFGRIDLLHNNASILRRNENIEDMTIDDFRAVVEINTIGSFLCARAVVPVMRRSGTGTIVNMSSRGGLRGQGHTLAYSTTKAGLVSFTRGLAEQLKPAGIKVCALSVGLVETAMTRGGAYLAQAKSEGRYVFQPEEMASAIAFISEYPDNSGAIYEYFGGEAGPEMRRLGDFSYDVMNVNLRTPQGQPFRS
ncbi:MAG: 3-ketoacyl-ACP reductase [Sphingomonadales bacterium]|nr:3-ketoacyl-ACP reductase [Sphingomonadales bacterium]